MTMNIPAHLAKLDTYAAADDATHAASAEIIRALGRVAQEALKLDADSADELFLVAHDAGLVDENFELAPAGRDLLSLDLGGDRK
jgi:hypothetical protein